MAGTKAGGAKAAATNKKLHGEDFYAKIGQKGGKNNSGTGGFASLKVGRDGMTGPERAKKMGAIGGSISRRGPSKPREELRPADIKTQPDDDKADVKESWFDKIKSGKWWK